MPANTALILQPVDQRVTSNSKSYYIKTKGATDSDSTDESGQSKLKTLWKGFIILYTFEICAFLMHNKKNMIFEIYENATVGVFFLDRHWHERMS